MDGSGTRQLIAAVHARVGEDTDPLTLVAAAAEVAAGAGRAADGCVDHFVGAARAAGISWTDIGEGLGVSKQAARQRFSARVASGNPFADPARTMAVPRLEACLAAARQAAAADESEMGTQHLLLGLLHAGVAASILDKLHVTHEGVRSSAGRLFEPTGGTDGTPRVVGDGAADEAVDRAARMVVERGQLQVRTEHLLLALAVDPGFASARVLSDLGVDAARVKKELDCRIGDVPRRRRRRGPAPRQCAFCGCRLASRAMVSGPGVWICTQCVALCAEILAEDPMAGVRP